MGRGQVPGPEVNKEEDEEAFRRGVSLINDHDSSLLPFPIQRVDPAQLQ